MLIFKESVKPEYPEKNLWDWSREENQQQTQPIYNAGSGNRTQDTLVGGERSHHCGIPAPLILDYSTCFATSVSLNETIIHLTYQVHLVMQQLQTAQLVPLVLHVQTHQTPLPSTHALQGRTLSVVKLSAHHVQLESFVPTMSKFLLAGHSPVTMY